MPDIMQISIHIFFIILLQVTLNWINQTIRREDRALKYERKDILRMAKKHTTHIENFNPVILCAVKNLVNKSGDSSSHKKRRTQNDSVNESLVKKTFYHTIKTILKKSRLLFMRTSPASIKNRIDNRNDNQCQEGRGEQTTNHNSTQWLQSFAAFTEAESDG